MPLFVLALGCALSLSTITPVNSAHQTTSELTTELKADASLYKATRKLDLIPVAAVTENGDVANVRAEHLELDKGDYVLFERLKVDDQGRRLVRISFDPVDENAPTTYWINFNALAPSDFEATPLADAALAGAALSDETFPEDEYVETQEASRYRLRYARHARRGNFCMGHPTHARCCKSAVNYKLLSLGLIHTRVPGIRARTMARGLAQQGWREVGCGARNAPTRGMTCTLVGRDNDHTETYTNGCWYYGSACTPRPMQQSNRQCISCKVPGNRR